jgi:hypothetical protein
MIFERLTQIIVSSANLLEAETDRMQQKAFLLVISLFLIFISFIIAGIGLYFLGLPLYQWLVSQMGAAAAQCLLGAILIIVAGGITWKSLKLLQ